jgi:hypothetical protein
MGWAERAGRMDDKRYRECMAEIVGVLRKYDMAAAVHLVSKERAMFRNHFPTWSVITLEEAGIRFRSKREDFPSLEAQKQAVELSAHIVLQLRDLAALTFGQMDKIAKMLEERFDVEHEGGKDFDPELSN